MATYVLAEYEQEQFNKETKPEHASTSASRISHGWARLSPFNMPDQVSLSVDELGVVRFILGYPNDEPARARELPVDSDISLRVGRFSGKVLEVLIRNALARFRAGNVTFDAAVVEDLARHLPADRQFACRRNAEVVSLILRQMPHAPRRWVIDQLQTLQHQPANSAESNVKPG
jgi:hypothetical protein